MHCSNLLTVAGKPTIVKPDLRVVLRFNDLTADNSIIDQEIGAWPSLDLRDDMQDLLAYDVACNGAGSEIEKEPGAL